MESKIIKYNLKYKEPESTMFQMLDKNGNIIYVNSKWLEDMGYEEKEVLGRFFGDFVEKESIESIHKNFSSLIDYGFVNNIILKLRRKDNVIIEGVLNGVTVYDENGKFVNTRCELKNLSYFLEANKYIQSLLEQERFLKNSLFIESEMNHAIISSHTLKEFLDHILYVISKPVEVLSVNISILNLDGNITSNSNQKDPKEEKIENILSVNKFKKYMPDKVKIIGKKQKVEGYENIQSILEEGEMLAVIPIIPDKKIQSKKIVLSIHFDKLGDFEDSWLHLLRDIKDNATLGINTFEMYENTKIITEELFELNGSKKIYS